MSTRGKMDRWLDEINCLDEIDELDYMYRIAPAAVYNAEPPPRIHNQEDAKLETQYSEGSGDESEDDSSGPALDSITEQLRLVDSVNWANYKLEDTKNAEEEDDEEEEEEVVLTKSNGLNPEVTEFVPKHMQQGNEKKMPKYMKGQLDLLKKAMRDTISQNELLAKHDLQNGGLPEEESEQENHVNQSENQENHVNQSENQENHINQSENQENHVNQSENQENHVNQNENQEKKANNICEELKQPEQPLPSKLLPKARNAAITSLLRLRALEADTLKSRRNLSSMNTLLKPDDFLTPPSASSFSPLVAPLVDNAATELSPPSVEKAVTETNESPFYETSTETNGPPSQSVYKAETKIKESPPSFYLTARETNEPPSQSVYKAETKINESPPLFYKTATQTNEPPSQSVYKAVRDTNESPRSSVYRAVRETNGSSSSSSSTFKPVINTKSPPLSARDVVSSKNASPKRTIAKEIPLVIREYVVPEPQPKSEPETTPKPKKTKKCTEFVSTSKSSLYYDKYSIMKKELELEKAAGQTAINTVNALIEVKLKEYQQDGGKAATSACKTKS